MTHCQAEDGLEGNMSIKSAVVAKDEFVQVRIDVFAAEAVVGAEAPPLQQGEEAMNPSQRHMRRHAADRAGIVPVIGKAGIGRVEVVLVRWTAWRLG